MLNRLLEIAYPPVCEGCGTAYFEGDIPGLCRACHDEKLYPLVDPYCPVCGQNYPGKMPSRRCSNCSGRYLDFDFALGAYLAEGEIMNWIHRFKYVNEIHFARTFGRLMTRIWIDSRFSISDDWIVVPVPLHRKRFRERGFNQSLEIAREWIRHSPKDKNLKIVQALKRQRDTTRQATLDRKERLTNLQGAFVPAPKEVAKIPENSNIIIVDDVLTTGTTASECASILRETVSPNKITVITAIRG